MALTYRDMAFCDFYRNCARAGECPRPMTQEVLEAADEYGLPVARYADKPDCHAPTGES